MVQYIGNLSYFIIIVFPARGVEVCFKEACNDFMCIRITVKIKLKICEY